MARSAFADANNSRPVVSFKDLSGEMYGLCAARAPKHEFRFKSKLLGIDAATIKHSLSLFPWASFRQAKGGIKMRAVLDHAGGIPMFITVTDAKTHENRIAGAIVMPKGSIAVFDKGHDDYSRLRDLGSKGIHFVTRLKRNATCKLPEHLSVVRETGVTSDHSIEVHDPWDETSAAPRRLP